jgi:hypothetical protein
MSAPQPLIPLLGISSTHPVMPDNLVEDRAIAQQIAASRQQQQQSAALMPGQLEQQGIQAQLGHQQVQQNANQMAAMAATNAAYKNALTVGPDGVPSIDRNKVITALGQSGVAGSEIPGTIENFTKMDKTIADAAQSKAKAQQDELDYMGAVAKTVIDSNFDPNITALTLSHAKAIYPNETGQLQQILSQNPSQAPQIFHAMLSQSGAQQKAATEKEQADARLAQANKPTAETLAVAAAGGDTKAKSALDVLQGEKGQVTPALQYTQNMENYRAMLARQASTANELQRQGISNLQKQSDTYSQFLSTANSLKNSLAAAQNGNEMAAAVAPLQGTLFVTTAEGVKRINQTELQGVEGAGSLVQRINGELGKQTGKGPLSDQLKNDMASLVDLYTASKYDAYKNQAAYTQKLHGLNPATTPILDQRGNIAGSQSGTGDTVRVQIPGHPPGTIPRSALKQFQQENPGAQVLQ